MKQRERGKEETLQNGIKQHGKGKERNEWDEMEGPSLIEISKKKPFQINQKMIWGLVVA